jgi:prevent-host-death family protein
MATRMGIRELRDTLTATVRRVRAGERIEITHDGEPVALLVPVPRDRIARLVAAGVVTRPAKPFVVPAAQSPITGPMSASEALEEDRGD